MRAVNRDGEGPWSEPVVVRSLASRPPTSRDLTKEVVAGGVVEFSANDFHFEDPDTAHDRREGLGYVKIVTAPSGGVFKLNKVPSRPFVVTDGYAIWHGNLASLVFEADTDFSTGTTFTFKVLDWYSIESDSTYTATILEVTNLSPAFSAAGTLARSVEENSAAGTPVGDPVAATDPENDALTYSLAGADAAAFDIDPATGQIEVAQGTVLDHETNSSYTVTVSVSDGRDGQGEADTGVDASVDVTIGISDVIEAPPSPVNVAATTLASTALRVSWEAPAATPAPPVTGYWVSWVEMVLGVPGTDVQSEYVGVVETSYVITGLTPGTQYQVKVWSANSDGPGDEVTVDPAPFTSPNSLPTSVDVTRYGPFDFKVSDFAFLDADDNEYSMDSLSGVRIVTLAVIPTRYYPLRFRHAEALPVYAGQLIPVERLPALRFYGHGRVASNTSFTFRVLDSYGGESTETYTYHLNLPKNLAPAFEEGTTTTRHIRENSRPEAAVGAPVAAHDPSAAGHRDERYRDYIDSVPTQELTYSLSGEDAAYFVIDASTGQLTLAEGASLDYEAKPLHTVTVDVHDGLDVLAEPDTSIDASIVVNVHVEDVDEPPDGPAGVGAEVLSSTTIRLYWQPPEDNSGRPPIESYVIASDTGAQHRNCGAGYNTCPDPPTALSHTFTGLTPGTDYVFTVYAFSHEGDSGSRGRDHTVSATTHANDLPESAGFAKLTRPGVSLPFSADEFAFSDDDAFTDSADRLTRVRIVTLPDPSQGTLRWTAGDGAPADVAAGGLIDHADLGTLIFETADGFTGPATFTYKVADRYGGESASAYTVTVSYAANLRPVFTQAGPLVRTVQENSAAGTGVGEPVTASDPDASDTVRYTLTGADASLFTIDADGRIRVAVGADLNYEGDRNKFSVTVNAGDRRDDNGAVDTAVDTSIVVTVNVTNVVEPAPAPAGVTVSALSPGSARVSWQAPDTTGASPIAGYWVMYSTEPDVPYPHANTVLGPLVAADKLAYELTGLLPLSEHYLKVIAQNAELGVTDLDQAAVASFTAPINLGPTSANILKGADTVDRIPFNAADFAFTDTTPDDFLAYVRIVILPDPAQGKLRWQPGSGDQIDVPAGGLIAAKDLYTLVFLPRAGFESTAFTFRVVDRYGGESPVYTADVRLRRGIITGAEISSAPAGSDNTYYQYEIISVGMTFDFPVSWTKPADESIYVDLEVGGATRRAHLRGTEGDSSALVGEGRTLYFDYRVGSRDVDSDGISLGAGVVEGGIITASGTHNRSVRAHPGLAADPSHKVDGTQAHNARAQFSQDVALAFQVQENSPGGTAVGSPVTATDADGDTVTYRLEGEDAGLFRVDSAGQITVAPGTTLDAEDKVSFRVSLVVSDGKNDLDRPDPDDADDSVVVDISILGVAELPPRVSFTVTVLSDTSVRVDWEAPDTTGIPDITHYYVDCKAQYGGSDCGLEVKSPEDRSHTITGLQENTSYFASMTAENADGYGPFRRVAFKTNARPMSADFEKEALPGSSVSFEVSDFAFTDYTHGDSLQSVRIVTVPEAARGTLKLTGSDGEASDVAAGQIIAAADLDNLFFETPDDFVDAGFTFDVADMFGQFSRTSYTATVAYPRARITDVSITSTPRGANHTYYLGEDIVLTVTFSRDVTLNAGSRTVMPVQVNQDAFPSRQSHLAFIQASGRFTGRVFNFTRRVVPQFGAGNGISINSTDSLLEVLDTRAGGAVPGAGQVPVGTSVTDSQGYAALLDFAGLEADGNHKVNGAKLHNNPARFSPRGPLVRVLPENSPAGTPVGGRIVTVTARLDGDARGADTGVDITLSGTAAEGSDYSASFPGRITIPAGSRTGTASLLVHPRNDAAREGAETIVVSGAATGFTVSPATVTVIDDDTAATGITLSVSPTHLPEVPAYPSAFTLTASLDDNVARSTDTPVTISLGGTASRRDSWGAYADYRFTISDITIPAGQVSAATTLIFRPVPDALVEGAETIVVSGASAGFTVSPATVTIVDDNAKWRRITLSVSPVGVKEAGGAVTAVDIEGDTLTYRLFGAVAPTSYTESDEFAIDPSTGVITVKPGAVLNRETRSAYRLTVGVSDGKDSSGATSALECTIPGADPSTDFRACDDLVVVDVTVANVVELPGSPPGFTAVPESSTSIRLEWSPAPDQAGEPVTGYRLTYGADAGDGQPDAIALTEQVIDAGNGAAMRHVVTGLAPGTTYYFRLRAVNREGDGEPVDASVATHTNSAPDSADFDVFTTELASVFEFAASDFPFTDADAGTATGDSLKAVTILSHLFNRICGGIILCGAELELDGVRVQRDDVIAFADLDRLQMKLAGPWYHFSTFDFRVIDQYGAESPTYTARLRVADPVVTSVSVISVPGRHDTYLKDEVVRVEVESDIPLRWYDDSEDEDGYLYVTLDIGGREREAKLSRGVLHLTDGRTQTDTPPGKGRPYHRWIFSYTVTTEDVDADGVSVVPDAGGNLVRAHNQVRLEHTPTSRSHSPTAHEGLADQRGHRVNGDAEPNLWPVFEGAPGPVTREVWEFQAGINKPAPEVGAPVTATDPDGDALVYSLSGDDADDFTVDPETGQISVDDVKLLDYEGKDTYHVTVHVTDNKDHAGNKGGASIDASIDVTIRVVDAPEPALSPVDLKVTVLGSFSVRVDWDHPDNSGRPPRSNYHLTLRPSLIEWILPPDATSKVVTDLHPGSTLSAVMWAQNDEWTSAPPYWLDKNLFGLAESDRVTTERNTLPTSADFTVYARRDTALAIDKEDFPYADPDIGRHSEEKLTAVRILTLPDPAHGKLVRRVGGLPDRDLPAGSTIIFSHGRTLVFIPATDFSGYAGFTFKVIDHFGGESLEVSAATIQVTGDPPQIETAQIVSTPYRHDGVYGNGDVIEVEVAWDRDVTWNIPEGDASSFIGLRLTVGSTSRWARPISTDRHPEEFPASGTARRVVFAYEVQAADLDTDGVSVPSGVVVHLFGRATLRDPVGQDAGRELGETVHSLQPVNGGLHVNYRPRFIEAGPLTRVVAENTAPGTLLGAPVLAVDSNAGDTLTYSLSGPHAADFSIDAGGQIRIGEQTALDFEKAPNTYTFTVEVRDGKNSLDVADTAVDDAIDMTVTVTNVPEPVGNVQAEVLSAHQIRVTWSAPDSANANYVSHYELAYRELFPKNPPYTDPDVFDEWTTMTYDRDTRQVTLEDLQPYSHYDIVLRAVQKGVDAPEVSVRPMPRTHVAPCDILWDNTALWQDIHKYIVVRPGPTTLDLSPAPAYLGSGELSYRRLYTKTRLCDEEGRLSPARVTGSTWINDPVLDRTAGVFTSSGYLDERTHGQPHGRLEPDTRYWYYLRIGGGTRGSLWSTYRLAKTTKARTGITMAVEPGKVQESAAGATVSVTARMNDNATFHPYHDISMDLTLSGGGMQTTAEMVIPQWVNRATGEITVPTPDDEVVRAPRTVTVTGRLAFPDLTTIFKNVVGYGLQGYPTSSAAQSAELGGLPVSSTTFIIDEDDIGLLSITGPAEVAEGDTAVFTVALSRQVDAGVRVFWSATGAHATDHTPHSGSVYFGPNQPAGATRTFSVTITDDTKAEPAEQFTVKLFHIVSDLSDYLRVDPDASATAVTIADSDRVLIDVTGPADLAEGSTADYSVTLHRSLDTELTLSYTVTPRDGATAADYTTSAPGTLTFAAGVTSKNILVTAVDDIVHDPGESFTVTISSPQGGAGFEKILQTRSVTTSITDDDDPIAVTLDVAPDSLREGDASKAFLVAASRPAGVTPALDITLSLGGTAQAGDDYAAEGVTTLSFSAGETRATKRIRITPVNDSLLEGDETILINGSAGGVTVTPATITLKDNEQGTLTLILPSGSVEEGTDAEYTVRLSRKPETDLVVNWEISYESSDKWATGADLAVQGGAVNFPAGSPASTGMAFTVPIVDDRLSERAEVYKVALEVDTATLRNNLTLARGFGTTVIAESDPIRVDLVGPLAVSEGGTATYHALLSPSGGIPSSELSVDYATEDGTATAGVDYTASSGASIFTPTDHAPKQAQVTILADAVEDDGETFNFVISNPMGGGGPEPTLGNASVSTAITSDEVTAPSIALSAQPSSISEDPPATPESLRQEGLPEHGELVTVTALLSADRPFPWDTEVTLAFSGTASDPDDYRVITTRTVTIPANSLSGTGELLVTAVDNPTLDGDRTIDVEGSAVGISSISPATITIVDDDRATVTLSTSETVVNEGSSAQFDVRLSHAVGARVTVDWTATGADASDFSPASGAVTFPADSGPGAVRSFTIDIEDDDLSEATETLTVALGDVSLGAGGRTASGSKVVASRSAVSTIIPSNDRIVVSISPPEDGEGQPLGPVVEGDPTGAYTVTLSKIPTADLTVDLATADDSATAGVDYTAKSEELTFSAAAGETTKTFALATLEDVLTEGAESFDLALSNPMGGGGPAPTLDAAAHALEVEIDDDDFAVLSIQTAVGQVEEGGAAEFRVTLSKQVNSDVAVRWSTGDDPGGDFFPDSGLVSFPAGSEAGATRTITVNIADDGLTEPSETFTVSLGGILTDIPSMLSVHSGFSSARATIAESDPITVRLSGPARVQVNGQAEYRVSLDRFPAADLTVSYGTSDGTAAAGVDYTAVSGVLTFAAGETVKAVTVPVLAAGAGKTFNFGIFTPAGGGGPAPQLGTPSDITTTIVAGDGAPVDRELFRLSAVPNLVVESDGATTVTVTATLDPHQTLDRDVEISVGAHGGGTADEGDDYTFSPTSGSTIRVGTGETTSSVDYTLLPADDGLDEDNETIIVRGASADDLEIVDATIIITDPASVVSETTNTITLSVDPDTVSEDAASAVDVTVTATFEGGLTLETDTALTITLGGTAGSADYAASIVASVKIPAGRPSGSGTLRVTPTDDAAVEGDETIVVNGLATGFNVTGTTITLIDDDATPSNITLSVNPSSVSEGDPATEVTVTATLDGSSTLTSDTTVTISLGGTAGSSDYVASSLATVKIPEGQASGLGTLRVTPTGDAVVEGDETIVVSGSATGFTVTEATITLEDDDTAELYITGPSTSVTEGNSATYTVVLSKAAVKPVTVAWSASGVTAEAADFSPASGTVTFGAGSAAGAERTFTVTAADDDLSETSETFTVALGTVGGDLAGRVSVKTGGGSETTTIAESDPITVSLSGPSSVDEGDSTGSYTVSLSPSGVTPTADLTVAYATSDGSAKAGDDYTAASGTLRFTATDTADKTVTVSTVEDTLDEAGETFTFAISNPQGGGGPAPSLSSTARSVTTTISDDDDAPTGITLSVTPDSLGEGDSATDITVTATLDGSSTLTSDMTVNISLGGSAGASDYGVSSLASVTIPAGEASGSDTLRVTPTGDALVEGDETIVVSGSVTGFPDSEATITLEDDDTADLSVSGPSASVAEGSSATYTVTLSKAIAGQVKVVWSITAGTAAAGDYTATPSTMTFDAGSSAGATRTFDVAVTDDDLSETSETFGVALGSVSGDLSGRVSVKSGSGSVTTTIAESDPITVSLSGPSSVDEGDTTGSYTVSLSPSGVTPTADLTVAYGTSDGSATAGDDYTAASGTLTFTTADAAAKTVTVSTSEDTLDEANETFTFSISNPQGGGGPAPSLSSTARSVTTTISDDDATPTNITLSVNPSSVGEGDSATDITVTATLVGDSTLTSDTTVTISLGGSAGASDYGASALASVTIPAGEASGSETLTVTPKTDAVVEGDETIVVSGSVTGFSVAEATITLEDDDTAEVSIAGPSASVAEGSNATYTVKLSAAVAKEVTVAWSATAGTAEGSDFSPASGSVTFGAGSAANATQTFTVTATDDALSETSEKFTVALGTVSGDLSSLVSVKSGAGSVTTTIAESDPITVTLSGPSSVDEGDTTGSYTVSLSPSGVTPTADLTVDYATAAGTATAGLDYMSASGTLTFTRTDTADKTVTVSTVEDTLDEAGETFTFSISNVAGGGGPAPSLSSTARSVTTTIGDDDATPSNITLSVDPTSVGEGDPATDVTVTATLVGDSTLTSVTTVTISLGGTAGSSDYGVSSLASVKIPAGKASGSDTLKVTPKPDAVVEGDETIVVSGSATGFSVAEATITLEDDDTAELYITGPSASVAEGRNATYMVTLSKVVAKQVRVAWTGTAVTAEAADFSPASGTLTFAADSPAGSSETFTVAVADDVLSETAETFTVALGTVGGDLSSRVSVKSGGGSVTTTIAESDPITVSLSGPSSVDEGDTTSNYTVSLLPSGVTPTADLTVNYATSDGSATAGDDYTSTSGRLTFTATDAGARTVTVSTVEDTFDEAGETFTFAISNAQGGGGPAPSLSSTARSVTTTISDDDGTPSSITLSVDPDSVGEGDPATEVTVTATLVGDSTLTSDTTVTISLGGTAGGSDYGASTLASVTIPAGAPWGSGTLRVTPKTDSVVEGDETIVVSGSVTGFSVAEATITLEDDDTAEVSVAGPSVSVAEGSNATYTVTLSAAVAKQVRVAWTGIAVTAEAADFSPASGSVTFGADSPAGSSETFTVAVADDALSETAETFTVALGTVGGDLASRVSVKSGVGSVTTTIAESDPITVSLSGPSSVDEGDTTSRYTVSLSPSGVTPTADLTVAYGTSDGSATAGDDYTAASGTLRFTAADAGAKTVTVATVEDILDEAGETFTFAISSPQGGGGPAASLSSTARSVTTTISDDDATPSSITLSVDPDSVGEGDSATDVTVTATLVGDSTLTSDTTVTISLGGTAGSSDYGVSSLASVTIAAGEASGSDTLRVTPTGDAVVEGDETIVVSGSAAGFAVTEATITLEDDDTAEVSVSGPTGHVAEGSNATHTVTLSAAVAKQVQVAWAATAGTAEAADFSPSSGSVTFGAGSAAGTTRTFNVAVTDDALSETSETFTVALGVITSDVSSRVSVKSGSGSVTTTIAESDPITVSLSGPSSVDEGDTTSNYTVSLSPSGVTPTADLTVNYATSDGSARAGDDYTAASGTLTFTAADAGDKTVTVSTVEDSLDEPNETFAFSISNVQGGGGPAASLSSTAKSVTTTISDDDATPTKISLSVDPTSVGESDAATDVRVTATLEGDSTLTSDTTVTLSLGGTAGSSDYGVSSLASVTIPAGEALGSDTLRVTPKPDAVVEGDETIVVAGSATGFTVAEATVTLEDDDSAELSVSGPSASVAEGSSATYTVTLSRAIAKQVKVDWSAAAGTAASSDYAATPSTVTFAASSAANATKTFTVAAVDDDLSETAETFTVALGTVSGDLASRVSVKSGSGSVTTTIAESDPITVTLSGPTSVDEGDTTSSYTVSLSPSGVTPTADLTVAYGTSNGSATAGDDYTAASGTLRFTAADAADKTVTVSTVEDSLDEPNETFTFAISNVQGGGGPAASLSSTARSVTTTISDDDATPTNITLSVNPSSVGEGDPATEVTVTATLVGDSTLTSDTTVTISLGGTAGSSDYGASSLASVTIPAGESSGSETLTVTPTGDAVVGG